jgi:uncharacterized protein (DUF1800 family)
MQDQVATVRILGMQPDASGNDGMYGLYWMQSDLGDAPMGWHPPNGYPDVADAWRSAGGSIGRWNMHMSLAAHWCRRASPPPLQAPAAPAALDARARRRARDGLVFRKPAGIAPPCSVPRTSADDASETTRPSTRACRPSSR